MMLHSGEFGLARELKVAPGLEEGLWRVCNDYKVVKRDKEGKRLSREKWYLAPVGDRWRTTRPLEEYGLLIELARLWERCWERRDFEGEIINFVREHGLLGLGPQLWYGGPHELLHDYLEVMRQAALIVRLYEAVLDKNAEAARELLRYPSDTQKEELYELGVAEESDDRRTVTFKVKGLLPAQQLMPHNERLGDDGEWYEMGPLEHAFVEVCQVVAEKVHEHCHVTAIPPKRSHDVSKIRTGWAFDSLLGPAYLQMYWHIGAQGRIKRCKYCGALIQNPRANRNFCPSREGIKDKCKADWNYHRGTGKSSREARKRTRQAR
jgi:hypothetical protein